METYPPWQTSAYSLVTVLGPSGPNLFGIRRYLISNKYRATRHPSREICDVSCPTWFQCPMSVQILAKTLWFSSDTVWIWREGEITGKTSFFPSRWSNVQLRVSRWTWSHWLNQREGARAKFSLHRVKASDMLDTYQRSSSSCYPSNHDISSDMRCPVPTAVSLARCWRPIVKKIIYLRMTNRRKCNYWAVNRWDV